MLRGFEDMAAGDSFYTFIITYSGHGPYTEEMGNIAAPHLEDARKAVEKSGVKSTPENMEEYTRAVAHAMETDQFIGGAFKGHGPYVLCRPLRKVYER